MRLEPNPRGDYLCSENAFRTRPAKAEDPPFALQPLAGTLRLREIAHAVRTDLHDPSPVAPPWDRARRRDADAQGLEPDRNTATGVLCCRVRLASSTNEGVISLVSVVTFDSSSGWVEIPECDNHRLGGSWSRPFAMPQVAV